MPAGKQGRFAEFCRSEKIKYLAKMLSADDVLIQNPRPSVQERLVLEPLIEQFHQASQCHLRACQYVESMGCPKCYIEQDICAPLDESGTMCERCKTKFE